MAAKALIIDLTRTLHPDIERLAAASDGIGDFLRVKDSAQALRLLHEAPADLILFAWTPATWRDGLDLLGKLRKRELWQEIPFLACTDTPTPPAIARAFEAGAADALCLAGSDEENLARIGARLRQRERSAEQHKKMEQLAHMAVTDMLTGLYNRAYFDATLELEAARSRRTGYPFSLLLIDLDYFKQINDTYGHPLGDEVLRTVAAIFRETARQSDVVCRYGGEEFAILLPGASAAAAFQIAERLRKRIAAIAPRHLPISCSISVSIGVSSSDGQDTTTGGQLLEEADCALYSCKQNGRNRSEFYSNPDRALEAAPIRLYAAQPMGRA